MVEIKIFSDMNSGFSLKNLLNSIEADEKKEETELPKPKGKKKK